MEKQKIKLKTWVPLIAFIALNIFILFKHELWADDCHTWNLAKNCSIGELYALGRAEGHPMLFYLILKPFVLLGCSPVVGQFVSLFAVILAVWILLEKVQINYYAKLFLIFAHTMTGLNTVTIRSYSITILAIVVVLATFTNRKEKPLQYGLSLAFLAQTHLWLAGFIAGFWLLWLIEAIREFGIKNMLSLGSYKENKLMRESAIGFLIYSFSIVWLLMQLLSFGVTPIYINLIAGTREVELFSLIKQCVVSVIESFYMPALWVTGIIFGLFPADSTINIFILIVALAFGLISMAAILIKNKKNGMLILLGLWMTSILGYYATGYNLSRIGITMLLFFGLYFLDFEWAQTGIAGKLARVSISAFACIIFACSLYSSYCEIVNFTDSNSITYQMAMKEIGEDETLFVLPSNGTYHFVAEYQTYADKSVYNLATDEFQSYLKYQHGIVPTMLSVEEILSKIDDVGVNKDSAVVLFAYAEELFTDSANRELREYLNQLSESFSVEEFDLPEELFDRGIMMTRDKRNTVFLLKPL